MAQIYILDNVIRKLSESESSNVSPSSTQKLVILDIKNWKILKKKPIFPLGSQLEFFLVCNDSDPQNTATSNIRNLLLDNFSDHIDVDPGVGICVKYQVCCPAGNEEEVAKALYEYGVNTPGVVFERKLVSWLKSYISSVDFNDFRVNYEQKFLELRTHAECEAKKLGLSLRVTKLSLELDESDQLKTFSIDSGDFPVLLKDFQQEQVNFRFRADLAITENGKIDAIIRYAKLGNLYHLMRDASRRYFRQNTCLHDFCYRFDDFVYPGLISYLDKELSLHGRKIEGFYPGECFKGLRMPDMKNTIKHNIKHEIPGYGEVIIENKLDVEPEFNELGEYSKDAILKYRKANISNLEEWFKEKLERTIRKYLFDWSYVDVLLNYNDKLVKKLLNQETEVVGYSVRLISTTPNLKPLVWRTVGFRFPVDESLELADESFSTKQNSVRVKLGIEVRGKIENLQEIKDILNNPQNDVEELIAKEIKETISDILHDVEPDDFYYYFEDHPNPNEASIKQRLTLSIENTLKSKFYASAIKVTLKMLETDLIQKINTLKTRPCEFEVHIGSIQDAEEIVKYSGSFRVGGVAKNGWGQFQSCEFTIENVRECIEAQLKDHFRQAGSSRLIYKSPKLKYDMLEKADMIAKAHVFGDFGLLVTISLFGRADTKIEELERDTLYKDRASKLNNAQEGIANNAILSGLEASSSIDAVNSIREELRLVQKYLRELITQPGNEERKNRYRQQEADLQEKLSIHLRENQDKSNEIVSKQTSSLISDLDDDFDAQFEKMKRQLPEEHRQFKSEVQHLEVFV